MTTRTLAVVSAGLSQPSSSRLLADRLADAVTRHLEERGISVSREVVEVRDHAHDVVNNTLTGFASPDLQRALETVAGADGLIAVTPIFNASNSGLFKSFFDVLDDQALVDKPVLLGATGGTARHSLALEHGVRPMFSYLRAITVPTAVFAASQDWGSTSDGGALVSRIERAGRELAREVAEREAAAPVDPFESPTPFADLLAGA